MTFDIITNRLQGKIKASNVEYKYQEKLCKGAQFKITLPIA